MPQFELQLLYAGRSSGLVRGRDLEDAVRRALELDGDTRVALGDPDGAAAWREVLVDGARAGRGRPHQRMRFRRD
jgi:hypothetical protein